NFDQPLQSIETLRKLVTTAESPLRSVLLRLQQRGEMQPPGLIAAHHHSKGIVEAQGLSDSEMKTLLVFLFHQLVHGRWITLNRLLQNRCQRCSGVLGIQIDTARDQ